MVNHHEKPPFRRIFVYFFPSIEFNVKAWFFTQKNQRIKSHPPQWMVDMKPKGVFFQQRFSCKGLRLNFLGKIKMQLFHDLHKLFKAKKVVKKKRHQMSHEKKHVTFHYTSCFIGILVIFIMVYYNPLYTWVV